MILLLMTTTMMMTTVINIPKILLCYYDTVINDNDSGGHVKVNIAFC